MISSPAKLVERSWVYFHFFVQTVAAALLTGPDLPDSASSPVDAVWKQTYIRVITILPTFFNLLQLWVQFWKWYWNTGSNTGCPRTIRSDKFRFKCGREVYPQGAFVCGVCMLSMCLCRFSLGIPTSTHSPETCTLGGSGELVTGSLSCVGAPSLFRCLKSVPETPTFLIFFSSDIHLPPFHVFILGKRNNPAAFLFQRQNFSSLSDNFPNQLSCHLVPLHSLPVLNNI